MSLDIQLSILESSALIRLAQLEPDREYLFRHGLMQEAAYSSLVRAERRLIHQRVGEAVVHAFPDRLKELAPLVAKHFDEAGDRLRAGQYYGLAGDAAMQVYANAEAVMHYTRALETANLETADGAQLRHLYTSRGHALELMGQFERALTNYEDMEALAHKRGDRWLELAALTARTTLRATPTPLFDPAQGKPLADQTLALAHELGDRAAEAKILWNLLLLHYFIGALPQAAAYGEQSLAIAQALDLREQQAYARHNLGMVYLAAGQTEPGRQSLAEAERLWRALDNQHMLAESLLLSGRTLYMLGEFDSALAASQAAYNLSRDAKNLWIQACCGWLLGALSVERGHIDTAIAMFEDAIGAGQAGGFSAMEAVGRAELGWLYGRLGEAAQGLELAGGAAVEAKSADWPPEFRAWVAAVRASVQVLNGAFDQAEAVLAEGTAGFDHHNLSTPAPIMVGWAEAELALAKGTPGAAIAIIDNLTTLLQTAGLKTYLPHTWLLKSRALLAEGQFEAARQHLVEAQALAEHIGLRRELRDILFALSDMAGRRGDAAEAQALRQHAQEHMNYVAGHIAHMNLRTAFLSQRPTRSA